MTMFDRTSLKALRSDLQSVLDSFGQQHDVDLTLGNCSFTAAIATFKLNVMVHSEEGETTTKEAEDFKRYAFRYGLRADALGKKFKTHRDTYTLIGCHPKSHKYPLIGVDSRGTRYKFAVAIVSAQLGPTVK